MEQQLNLFGEEEIEKPKPKRPSGGSQNPIVFNDYESYVAKFQDSGPKTTDDTYTPRDVYEAVLNYVGTIYDLTDKVILRPFYPGGDYEHAEYPENGVVIDNAYTGDVLEEAIEKGTTIKKIALSGPYKGIKVIVTPIEMNGKTVAAIGVVDIRGMNESGNLDVFRD